MILHGERARALLVAQFSSFPPPHLPLLLQRQKELYESADGARQALLLLVLLMFLVLDDAGPASEAAETQSK
jgi:hypothetical protein